MPGACGLRPCARTHHKKCPLGGAVIKYRRSISVWTSPGAEPLQAFTPFVGWVGLGSSPGAWECRRGCRHLWKCRVRVGYGPAPGPTKKRHTCSLGGAVIKYRRSISVLSEQYETSYLFYVTVSFLCNIICYLISVFAFSLVTLSGATPLIAAPGMVP